jgi:hypothetical protein
LTLTVTVKVPPLQEPANEGVTLYTTSIGAFVVLLNVPPIVDAPEPATKPSIPPTEGADQLYVTPLGSTFEVLEEGSTENDEPLHIVLVSFCIEEPDPTVTVTVNEGPVQVTPPLV